MLHARDEVEIGGANAVQEVVVVEAEANGTRTQDGVDGTGRKAP